MDPDGVLPSASMQRDNDLEKSDSMIEDEFYQVERDRELRSCVSFCSAVVLNNSQYEIDSSTVGSDDVLNYCDNDIESDKSVQSSVHIFREPHWARTSKSNLLRNTSNNSSYDDETILYLCEGESSDNEDDLEEGDFIEIVGPSCFERQTLLTAVKRQSLLIGFLVGIFIQFSTLGANFLLYKRASVYKENEGSFHLMYFNLYWSFFTSMLGVALMLAMRIMLSGINNTISLIDESNTSNMMLHLECFFAGGALVGVCLAWIATDIILNLDSHMFLSILTLIGALIWCKVLSVLFLDQEAARTELQEPLLKQVEKTKTTEKKKNARCLQRFVALVSLVLGILVGLFIQFSSLGANYLMEETLGSNNEEGKTPKNDKVVQISVLWSCFTSTMGIAILMMMRSLVITMFSASNKKKSSTVSFLTFAQDALVLNMECFFAVGATAGLNAGWTLTDVILGLDSHLGQSALTLVGTMIWCKIVIYCWGYKKNSKNNTSQNGTTGDETGKVLFLV